MNHRYIQHFRLPDRLYTPGSPVVLAAGALLEDTKLPRLVAQLKFKNISPKSITALTVTIRTEAAAVEFRYSGLSAGRGQTFGQYTAVVLPEEQLKRFTVLVNAVVFEDGTVWKASKDAVWQALPGFTALESVMEEPELLALSRKALRNARYVFEVHEDLWYCSCGGVNRDAEAKCHRCGTGREFAAQYADPVKLAALRQEKMDQAARREAEREAFRQEAEAKTAALKAAVEEKAAALKDAAGEKAAAFKALKDEKTAEIPKRKGGKKWLALGGAGAAVVVIAAAIILLPQWTGDSADVPADTGKSDTTVSVPKTSDKPKASDAPDRSAAERRKEPIHVTTPSDGETVEVILNEDSNGECRLTLDEMRQRFPGVRFLEFEGTANMGNDIDHYLIDSVQMAFLIGTNGEEGNDDQYGIFSARRDPNSPRRILLFDSKTHLMGYAVGVPEKVSEGVWRMHLTLCDYDFTELYQQQAAAYYASPKMPYIAPEDIDSSGVKWFLNAYRMRKDTEQIGHCQMYHLWSEVNSPYLERHCRDMGQFEDKKPRNEGDGTRCTYYVLLDRNREVIGYTMLTSSGTTVLPALE